MKKILSELKNNFIEFCNDLEFILFRELLYLQSVLKYLTNKIIKNIVWLGIIFVLIGIISGILIYHINKIKKINKNNDIEMKCHKLLTQYYVAELEKQIIDNNIKIRLIYEKVNNIDEFLNKTFPYYKYSYKDDIQDVFNDRNNIDKLPDDTGDIWMFKKRLEKHCLNEYILRIRGTIHPMDPEKSYVTSKQYEFGQKHSYEGTHTANDINNLEESQVYAVADGIIYKSYYNIYGGNTIELKCKIEGVWYFFRYRHVTELQYKEGDQVKQGDIIAMRGSTGIACDGYHLHFECWRLDGKNWININYYMNSTYGNRWVDYTKPTKHGRKPVFSRR